MTKSNQEEFQVFASWHTLTGAAGNGTADDTTALQTALNNLGTAYKVLYIPPGTYRITAQLYKESGAMCCIFGDNPATTKIVWDGPAWGTMFLLNGFTQYHMGRIHWDGRGIAEKGVNHAWEGVVPNAVTFCEHMDDWYTNFRGHGLAFGSNNYMDAETAVTRCKFIRCDTGVSTHSFNALDIWIRDCYFEHNVVGASNVYGGGNFHVHNSIFKYSKATDIRIGSNQYFGVRGNYSYKSRQFYFHGPSGNNASFTTIQNNTIIEPEIDMAINDQSAGATFALDNKIITRSGYTGSVINGAGDILAVGNKFTSLSGQVTPYGRKIEIDNTVVAANTIDTTEPTLQPIPRKKNREVYEVSTTNPDASIDAGIAWAVARNGQKPIIHFASGVYDLFQSHVIPPGSDMQIVGDGMSSQVRWNGPAKKKVLHLLDARNNTMKSLYMYGNTNNSTMVYVRHPKDKLCYIRMLGVTGAAEEGLFYDTVAGGVLECHGFNHDSNNVSVRINGGGELNIMSGASANNEQSYKISNGGKILAKDIWYEGAFPNFVNFTDGGTFTLSCSKIYSSVGTDAVVVDNFNGRANFIGVELQKKFIVKGDGTNTKVLAFIMYDEQYIGNYMENTSPNAQVQNLFPKGFHGGSYDLTQTDIPDTTFIRDQLAHLRGTPDRYRDGNVGFFMHRVLIQRCGKGVHVRGY